MDFEVVDECERAAALERIARINAEAIHVLASIAPRVNAAARQDSEGHFRLGTSCETVQ